MIQASELRTGNTVYNNVHNVLCGISASLFGDYPDLKEYPFLDPVLITPEILEAAGFKYFKTKGVSSFENDYNENEDTHCWSFDIKRTDLIDSHEICLVKWGKEEYFTLQLGRGTYRQRIKYLHLLQNIIYYLSDEELNPTSTPPHH
jgi:hypothetical protein